MQEMEETHTPAVQHIHPEKLNEIMNLKGMKTACDRCDNGQQLLYSYYIKNFFSSEDPPNPQQRQMILFMCERCGHIDEYDLGNLLNIDEFLKPTPEM
jgi:hypothetical protein